MINWNYIVSHPMTHLYVVFAVGIFTAILIALMQPKAPAESDQKPIPDNARLSLSGRRRRLSGIASRG